MKAIHVLLCFFLLLVLPACTADTDTDARGEETATETNADAQNVRVVPPAEIRFSCDKATEESYGHQSRLYLHIGNKRYFLDEVRGCNDFVDQDDYREYNIPEDAVAATYAQWSGYGLFFYMLPEGDRFKLYFSERNSIRGDDMDYDQIGTFQEGVLSLKEDWRR